MYKVDRIWRRFANQMFTGHRFAVLAPCHTPEAPEVFANTERDPDRYRDLLSRMQTLRASTYLEDGAITEADLSGGGSFGTDGDELCWHLLLLDGANGAVVGCVRLRVHSVSATFDDLRVKHAALARDDFFGARVRAAIEADLRLAREQGLRYAEIGGWALAKKCRNTKAALRILAGSYALGESWGGALGVAMATVRHGSASILRKMGAQRFVVAGQELPPYEDPQYGCSMEMLRFTRMPAERFSFLMNPMKNVLASSPVIVRETEPRRRDAETPPELQMLREREVA